MARSARRATTTDQNLDAQLATTAAIIDRPQRVSVRLFKTLKERLQQLRYYGNTRTIPEGAQEAHDQELRRLLSRTDKKDLVNWLMTKTTGRELAHKFNLRTPSEINEEAHARRHEQIEALVKEIDRAELAFLAGDSGPAQDLVAKVNAFV